MEGAVALEAGGSVGEGDVQGPGQPGGTAEQFLVEPVSPSADGLGQWQGGGHAVEEGGDVEVSAAGDDDPGGHAGGDAAPDAQPALPDFQGVEGMVGVQLVVGDDVVEAGADETGRHRPHGEAGDGAGGSASGFPAAL